MSFPLDPRAPNAGSIAFNKEIDIAMHRVAKTYVNYVNSMYEMKAEAALLRNLPEEYYNRIWNRIAELVLSDPFLNPDVEMTKEDLIKLFTEGKRQAQQEMRLLR